MLCMESDGVGGCSVAFRRSLVVRVASSEASLGLTGGTNASCASGLAGCVGGNGARGVVAHPSNRAIATETGKIREMDMDFSAFVSFRCLFLRDGRSVRAV